MSDETYYPFALMPGEEVIMETRPHPLSMLGLMFFWLSVAALGVVYIAYYQDISRSLDDVVKFEFLSFLKRRAYDGLWFASILLPMMVMAVFRINFSYVLTLLCLAAANFLLQWKVDPAVRPLLKVSAGAHLHLENIMLIIVGVVGMVGVEFFRRGHRYYLTNYRILSRFGSLKVSERSTLYSKVDDLILVQGLLGKIFNFGTVIPITSTGLGMGQDMAIAGAGMGLGKAGAGAGLFAAGAKGQNVPRELSMYVLYKVGDPAEARDLIFEEMADRDLPNGLPDEDSTEATED